MQNNETWTTCDELNYIKTIGRNYDFKPKLCKHEIKKLVKKYYNACLRRKHWPSNIDKFAVLEKCEEILGGNIA